jgi:pyrimidine operon attenuation protein/uracil phosphoribosyltransferase
VSAALSSAAKTQVLLEGERLHRTVRRMAHEIAELEPDLDALLFVGVEGAGIFLARELAAEIGRTFQITPEAHLWNRNGTLNGTLPSLQGRHLFLIDDVIFSGKTLLRLLTSLSGVSVAKAVSIAVLVDRGHRSVPLQATVVGLPAPTKLNEHIEVSAHGSALKVLLFR